MQYEFGIYGYLVIFNDSLRVETDEYKVAFTNRLITQGHYTQKWLSSDKMKMKEVRLNIVWWPGQIDRSCKDFLNVKVKFI